MKIKKLYYVPGIFTLSILPILITNWTTNFIRENKEYCIQLTLPDKPANNFSTKYNYYKVPAHRAYTSFEISDKTTINKDIINKIDKRIRNITINRDTINGLKIIFKGNAKYGDFINVINSCLKFKAKTFIPISDTLFIYFTKRGKFNEDSMTNVPGLFSRFFIDDGCFEYGLTFKTHEEYLKWKRNYFYNYWKSRFVEFYPIFFSLLILLILSFKWIYQSWKIGLISK